MWDDDLGCILPLLCLFVVGFIVFMALVYKPNPPVEELRCIGGYSVLYLNGEYEYTGDKC